MSSSAGTYRTSGPPLNMHAQDTPEITAGSVSMLDSPDLVMAGPAASVPSRAVSINNTKQH